MATFTSKEPLKTLPKQVVLEDGLDGSVTIHVRSDVDAVTIARLDSSGKLILLPVDDADDAAAELQLDMKSYIKVERE